ncbi:MAG: DsrE family protein [Desulfovibrionaceae bacterium]|nr:DsrE family protein [Desulfovibrionaceae bacterium]
MSEKQEKILYIGTHANDHPEKAHLPFVLGNAALAMDIKATVILQANGVYLAQKGFVNHMLSGGGFPPLKKLMEDFFAQGGELKVCKPCIAERNIDESDLIEKAEITAGGALNIAAIEADAVLVF